MLSARISRASSTSRKSPAPPSSGHGASGSHPAGKSAHELRKALADLRQFRVLDPACGSGNFLFVAYREMKRLERDLLVRLQDANKKEPLESAISLHQFHGVDNQPFAVELAKVTLMLAKELELIEARKFADADQLLIEEKPLPLDNLDKNIVGLWTRETTP